jgi:broad specificity phosphatase PhoE
MPASSVPILVLRHGQSEWNAVRRWQGSADSPLTPLGREQAATTARLLALGRPWSGVWTSDLKRASETAAIIAEELALGEPVVDPRLREADAGEWEGLTPDEIEVGWPGWLDDHRRPSSFESYVEVVARATAALLDVANSAAAQAPQAALVIAHSGVVRSLIRELGGDDRRRLPNLGGVWLGASTIGDGASPGSLELGNLFDPSGVVVSGIDAPGEDPGQ